MRTLTIALLALSSTLSGQQYVQEPKTFTYTLTGEAWLTVHRINDAKDKDQWHPSMTVVTSTYRPVVTKHKREDGSIVWEISFRSPTLPEPNLP